MRHSRITSYLALIAFLLSLAAPQALATWECEGRTCATTLWSCCCASPTGAQDRNCGSESNLSRPAAGAPSCGANCNCVLIVRTVDAGVRSHPDSTHPVPAHPAVLPRTPALHVDLPRMALVRAIEDRGPPAACGHFGSPSLRGPPAA